MPLFALAEYCGIPQETQLSPNKQQSSEGMGLSSGSGVPVKAASYLWDG